MTPWSEYLHITYLVAIVYSTHADHTTVSPLFTASLDNIIKIVWASFVRLGGCIAQIFIYFTHLFIG